MIRRIGLTGTLGAGKSSVGRFFERWGAFRIDADRLAREAVAPGRPAHRRIRSRWGDRVLDETGGLDRAALRRIVLADPAERRRLEEIVHPAVRALRAERRREAERAEARWIVEEVPLLFEVGLEGEYDRIVVVDAPPELRRERVLAARAISDDEFEALERAQIPAAEKRRRADFLVVNDGTLAELESRARHVWEQLTGTAGDGPGLS